MRAINSPAADGPAEFCCGSDSGSGSCCEAPSPAMRAISSPAADGLAEFCCGSDSGSGLRSVCCCFGGSSFGKLTSRAGFLRGTANAGPGAAASCGAGGVGAAMGSATLATWAGGGVRISSGVSTSGPGRAVEGAWTTGSSGTSASGCRSCSGVSVAIGVGGAWTPLLDSGLGADCRTGGASSLATRGAGSSRGGRSSGFSVNASEVSGATRGSGATSSTGSSSGMATF